MERYQEVLIRIKELLKKNPRGLTVTEIAKATRSHRNSVAKYLDVLRISGQIDLKIAGSAKIYFHSQRTPIATMLNFSSDGILVLDQGLRIVQVNENFLEFLDVERDLVLGNHLSDPALSPLTDFKLGTHIEAALSGTQYSMELRNLRGDAAHHFRLKCIPTTFDDGSSGATLILEDITEQKKAEMELRNERDRAKQYFNIAGILLIVLDVNRKITQVNKKGCQITGYTEAELIGQDVDIIFPRHFRAENRARFFQAMLGDSKAVEHLQEGVILTKTGEKRIISIDNVILKDEAGNIIGLLAAGEDITELKRTEVALRIERNRAQRYLDVVNVILIAYDLERTITLINNKGCELLGYTEAEIIGKHINILLPEDSRSAASDRIQILLKDPESLIQPIEGSVITKSGEKRFVIWRNVVLREDDQIVGMIASGEDITEQIRAAALLRAERDRTQKLLDVVKTIFIALDTNWQITLINKQGCEIFGYMEAEIIGETFDKFLPKHLRENTRTHFFQVMAGELQIFELPIESPIITKSGEERLIAWNNVVLRDQSGTITGILSSGEDLTDKTK